MVSKMVGIHIAEGQKVRLETPGGGGYGDPATRDLEAVARDVRLGYVTPEKALSDYRVAVTEGGHIEQTSTARLRNREAAE
jgi:N-methylhydantoinase B